MKYTALLLIILFSILHSQDFNSQPLVTLPGQNKNYVLTESFGGDVYICFENFNNNVFSIYLQQIFPYNTNLIVIASDTIPQINPTITYTQYWSFIKVVWQSRINGHWQLFSREFVRGELEPIIQLTSDSTENIEPSLSSMQLFWIRDNKLVFVNNYDSQISFQIIDSSICSNPHAYYEGDNVIYEQGKDSSFVIKSAQRNYDSNWIHTSHSDSGYNLNPRYGTFTALSYQKFDDGIWKGVVENWISDNKTYNITKPFYFIFPLITKLANQPFRDFFVVYESDSTQGNSEIIMEYVPDVNLPKINISNSMADDLNPYAIWMSDSIGIFWEQWENNASQIWCAKAKSDFFVGIHDKEHSRINDFYLEQNYPNPFNPNTKISFNIMKPSKITFKIFNLLGEEIKTLLSGTLDSGLHTVEWDGTNNRFQFASSGVYIYVLESGDFRLSKKMVIIK